MEHRTQAGSLSQPPKVLTEQLKQGFQGTVLHTVVYNHVSVFRETYFLDD